MSTPSPGWTGSALTVGDAVGYGWARFKANPWTWIGFVIIAAIIQGVLNALFGNRSTFRVDTFAQSLWTINWIIGSIVTVVIGYLINAAFVRGALHEVDGQRPTCPLEPRAQSLRLPERQGRQRRHSTEELVVMRDVLEPVGRDPSPSNHVLQERPDVIQALWATERDHQNGVERGHGWRLLQVLEF